MARPKNLANLFRQDRRRTKFNKLGHAEPVETHKISQALSVREGTVQDAPTAAKDIVNKAYADGLTSGLWEVDGTETQLIIADEIDMQTKKIINVTKTSFSFCLYILPTFKKEKRHLKNYFFLMPFRWVLLI